MYKGHLFLFLAPQKLKEQIPHAVTEPQQAQACNLVFEILRGSVIMKITKHTELLYRSTLPE